MARIGSAEIKLPKISEEKQFEEANITDFCASLQLTQEEERKEKLEVRSVYEIEHENLPRRRSKSGSSNKKRNYPTWNKFKDGFSKAHLFSAKSASKSKLQETKNHDDVKIIDLRNIKDAEKVADSFFKDLYQDDASKIMSYLDRFESADLTFPKLYAKEELFQTANQKVLSDSRIINTANSAKEYSRISRCNRDSIFDKRTFSVSATESTRSFLQNCAFYSKPVELRTTRHITKLPRVKSLPGITNVTRSSNLNVAKRTIRV